MICSKHNQSLKMDINNDKTDSKFVRIIYYNVFVTNTNMVLLLLFFNMIDNPGKKNYNFTRNTQHKIETFVSKSEPLLYCK